MMENISISTDRKVDRNGTFGLASLGALINSERRGQSIDEISDLKDVLSKSFLGPCSLELFKYPLPSLTSSTEGLFPKVESFQADTQPPVIPQTTSTTTQSTTNDTIITTSIPPPSPSPLKEKVVDECESDRIQLDHQLARSTSISKTKTKSNNSKSKSKSKYRATEATSKDKMMMKKTLILKSGSTKLNSISSNSGLDATLNNVGREEVSPPSSGSRRTGAARITNSNVGSTRGVPDQRQSSVKVSTQTNRAVTNLPEKEQIKHRMLITTSLHNITSELRVILEKRITKQQVAVETAQNAKIVHECDGVKNSITSFINTLSEQLVEKSQELETLRLKKKQASSKKVIECERSRRQLESAISFLKIERRSVLELRARFISVCNEVTCRYEQCNQIERTLSKWNIEMDRIYAGMHKESPIITVDYFKLQPMFQSCDTVIKEHIVVKQDMIRELTRREAARNTLLIYLGGVSKIISYGVDIITDERMVEVARVRGLEHQVHMLYHALHDKQADNLYTEHVPPNTINRSFMYREPIVGVERTMSAGSGMMESAAGGCSTTTTMSPRNLINPTSPFSVSSLSPLNRTEGHLSPVAMYTDGHSSITSATSAPMSKIAISPLTTIETLYTLPPSQEGLPGSYAIEVLVLNADLFFPSTWRRSGVAKSKASMYIESLGSMTMEQLIECATNAHIGDSDDKSFKNIELYLATEMFQKFFVNSPLFSYALYQQWLLVEMKELVKQLSRDNQMIIEALIKLLSKVSTKNNTTTTTTTTTQHIDYRVPPQLLKSFSHLILRY
ncbi:hypothetical protein SAMD00019534_019060 [Acytostelium subglobosum LB1]|uniref:hypothetical protein n=1 Tax=Acytostelium subglobosum LB1 TaxID=1410327 RepID=UPI0006450C39|nr:hypothetical protein SAMD00019534_019060 [Acytostelium subglobosum LB1]GAM18731.1 hypothetical protein SAMD00019534_019060 [Acytostelium subglobosum LB1]|eukprot:XP_012757951.1 hypothetical protein SAMD00019534_019060 [Acytostelium subglobosum LB1]